MPTQSVLWAFLCKHFDEVLLVDLSHSIARHFAKKKEFTWHFVSAHPVLAPRPEAFQI